MIAIECVSASGTAVPPLLIFKAKHTNTGWVPTQTPADWRFSTSNSGWISDSHGYEWLTTVFAPSTKPDDPSARRLLIMDGHSSHMTANVIVFCMQNVIDLLILPPHTSHLLQPLDVGVFAPLKRALACETDTALRHDTGRIPRVQWVEMYIRARERALTSHNITTLCNTRARSHFDYFTFLDGRLRNAIIRSNARLHTALLLHAKLPAYLLPGTRSTTS